MKINKFLGEKMKGKQQIEICPKCGKNPKLPKIAYCKDCKKFYDRQRYEAKMGRTNHVATQVQIPQKVKKVNQQIQPQTQVAVQQPQQPSPIVQQTELEVGDVKYKACYIEPPTEKPLFYDVDRNLTTIERILENNDTTALLFKGEAGTGKTTLIKYLQWKYKKPIIRINVTINTEAQELKGKYIIRRDDKGEIITEWVDGLITTALKNDYWLQIEEVNFMQREHQSIFYSLLDERREIILEDKGGEVVKNPNLVVFLTMNPLAFIKPLIPALKSRIDAEFYFSHPKEVRQKMILMKKHDVPEKLAEQISKTICLIRQRYEKLQISSREAESWVKLLKIKSDGYIQEKATVLTSFKHSIALKLSDDETVRSGLMSVAEAVMEGKLGYEEILNQGKEEESENV
jgi:MoxR-like ATPase